MLSLLAIALAWLRSNWRWVVVGTAAALVIGLWAYISHLQHTALAAKAKTQAAVQQAQIQTAATKAVDHVATVTTKVEERTHVVVRTIQAAPGSDAAVPGDVLVAWRGGLSDDPDPPN